MLKKLQIININRCNYTLLDNDNKQHEVSIIFYEFKPQLNDYIYLDEKIIKEINIYNFGPIKDKNIKDEEIIKIIRNKEEYYLQRYYG